MKVVGAWMWMGKLKDMTPSMGGGGGLQPSHSTCHLNALNNRLFDFFFLVDNGEDEIFTKTYSPQRATM